MTLRRLALLLPLLALGAASRAPFHLEDVLPESTLVFIETPSAPAFAEAFKRTPLAKLLEDEEVRAFAGEALGGYVKTLNGLSLDDKDFRWEEALKNVSGQLAVAMPGLVQGEKKEADFVITLDSAGHDDFLKKGLGRLRKSYDEKSGKKCAAWKAGEIEVLTFALQPDLNLHAAAVGDVVLFASFKGTMEKMLAAMRGGQPKPLAKAGAFLKAREKVASKEVFFYADVAGFMKEAKEDLEEGERKFIAALGLDGFTYAAGGLSIGDRGVVERFFLGTSGERKGLAKFLSLKGPAAGFEAAPQDALQFVSFSIELSELYDTIFEILKGADEFQQAKTLDSIAEFEKEVGFSIKNDLFPAFGPRIWWYSALPPGGILPDGVTGFEIRDAARFDKCLQAVAKRLQVEIADLDFKGRKIHYFKFDGPAGFDPVRMFLSTIYFLRDGDKIQVSSLLGGLGAANALKRHVLRQEKPNLASQASVLRWMNGKTDGASLVLYIDIAQAFMTAYNTLSPIALFFKDKLKTEKGGADLMKLPLGETLGKYLGQSITKVSVEPDGLRAEGISESGTTLMTAAVAGTAAVVLLPAVTKAADENRLGQCRSQASTVYFAVLSHLEEKKKYPDKTGAEFFKQLQELGYLTQAPLCPIGGGAYRGPAKDLNSAADTDVIFCDEPSNHGDGTINVLRRNGSMG
ncbi:MAG TPA: hypothetical protein VKU80_17365, partial [Planctomycetota bacterium]|nr:hypothetical protein [Planctomycetota bacterium]